MAIGTLVKGPQGMSIKVEGQEASILVMPGSLPPGPDFQHGKLVVFDRVPSAHPGRLFASNVRKPSMAEMMSATAHVPTAALKTPVHVPSAAELAAVPTPESVVNFCGDAPSFFGWVKRQATLVAGNLAGLRFSYGARYVLGDGTVSVPIWITRNNVDVARTNFVYHYHPGASGPSVGHAYGSVGHFKPRDGSPKHIRIEAHQFPEIKSSLVRDAKDKATR